MVIFATVFGVGFLLLIVSLIFGHDTDIHADTDFDADGHGPSVFSVKMLSLLMVGFGATGFGVDATTDASVFQSSMAGIAGAAVLGGAGYLIIKMFYRSQESSTISDQDIIGQTASLIDAIGSTGNGQIACVVRGREITFLARSSDGKSISRGTPVRIISKAGNIVTVERIEASAAE
jgi:membrane-bound ClpP family serine protease